MSLHFVERKSRYPVMTKSSTRPFAARTFAAQCLPIARGTSDQLVFEHDANEFEENLRRSTGSSWHLSSLAEGKGLNLLLLALSQCLTT